MYKLILHIGTKKTGSTTLQAALKGNSAALARRGVFVSKICGATEDKAATLAHLGRGDPRARARLDHWFRACGDFLDAGGDLAILSAESFADLEPEEIAEFRATLPDLFDEIRVVLYVRRQDRVAASHFRTALGGGTHSRELMSRGMGRRGRRAFSYGSVARDWGRVFGPGSVTVRLYRERDEGPWNIVDDFLATIQIAAPPGEISAPPQNTAITVAAAAHLRRYNELVAQGRIAPVPGAARTILGAFDDPAGARVPLPARHKATAFLESFAEENEILRQDFFPDREAVFDDRFDAYPERQEDLDRHVDAAVLARLLGLAPAAVK